MIAFILAILFALSSSPGIHAFDTPGGPVGARSGAPSRNP